jgi:hypothetical protein
MVAAEESSRPIKPFGNDATRQLMTLYAPLGEMDVGKVVEAVTCLAEIYHLFGLDRLRHNDPIIDQIRYREVTMCAAIRCLDYMESVNDNKSWIPYFKYKTCAFYASHEKQDIPLKPTGLVDSCPQVIFGGYFGSYLQLLKRSDIKKYESFCVTINQAKMGMPRADESMIAAAEEKCARHLTTQPVVVQDHFCDECGMSGLSPYHFANCLGVESHMYWGNSEVIDKKSMKRELRRTVQELFRGKQYTEELHYEPFFPSTSANYIRSRGSCGAVGIVTQIIARLGLFDPESPLVVTNQVDGKARSEIAKGFGDEGRIRQACLDLEREIGKQHNVTLVEYDESLLRAKWAVLMDCIKELAVSEDAYVEAVGLAEALKIRVISKGPPLLYTFLSPLQKFMWKVLKDNRVFKMISEPITADHVTRSIGIPRDDEIIINGDYKASTDNLHSWVSKTIGLEIVNCIREAHQPGIGYEFDDDHKDMFIRSLIHHFYQIDGVWQPQREGQLMGSVTSFPILCLANAAMCRWSLEVADNRSYRLTDKPYSRGGRIASLLINGDDCTLKGCRSNLQQIWERITSFGGLSTSVGKTLFSRVGRPICVLNSTTYHLVEGVWTHIKFVNMGIMFGKTRSGGDGTASRTYCQMGELHAELRKSCPTDIWEKVSERFIYFNGNALRPKYDDDMKWAIPWDMPQYLGGAGLEKKKAYSETDKWCASLIISKMKSCKRFRIMKERSDPMWIVHDQVQERFDRFTACTGFREVRKKILVDLSKEFKEPEFSIAEDQHSRLYKYLTIETLFRLDLKQIFRIALPGKKGELRATWLDRHNRYVRKVNNRTWATAFNEFRFHLHYLQQRQDHEICYEKKDTYLGCIAVPPLDG